MKPKSDFEGEIKSFRLSLIEQRNHLYQIYGSTTNDDIRQILLVLLQRTAEFIKLFPSTVCATGVSAEAWIFPEKYNNPYFSNKKNSRLSEEKEEVNG